MQLALNIVKWFVFVLNIFCFCFGIGDIYVNAVGVERAQPGSDAHTFFILAILLCSLLCLTTVIGCYGVFSEVFGINVIYSIFILALLIVQYLQINSYQPHDLYFNNLHELESAWRLVETHPKHMDDFQSQFYCCGLFNARDYFYKHLPTPDSCYATTFDAHDEDLTQVNNVGCLEIVRKYYKFIAHRHVLFNWALFITELITFIYSIVLNILILKRRVRPRLQNFNRGAAREFAHQNNIGSRQILLSN